MAQKSTLLLGFHQQLQCLGHFQKNWPKNRIVASPGYCFPYSCLQNGLTYDVTTVLYATVGLPKRQKKLKHWVQNTDLFGNGKVNNQTTSTEGSIITLGLILLLLSLGGGALLWPCNSFCLIKNLVTILHMMFDDVIVTMEHRQEHVCGLLIVTMTCDRGWPERSNWGCVTVRRLYLVNIATYAVVAIKHLLEHGEISFPSVMFNLRQPRHVKLRSGNFQYAILINGAR